MRELESNLEARSLRRVAVLVDERTALLPIWMAARWPSATVVCLTADVEVAAALRARRPGRVVIEAAPNDSIRHALLTAYGRFDVLVDWVPRSSEERSTMLPDLLFHLRRGGSYVTTASELDADSIAGVRRGRFSVVIDGPAPAMPKMRYHEMDRVLSIRPSLGRVVFTLPATTFRTRATVTMNRSNPGAPFAETFNVPAVGIREYHGVSCAPHQVLVADQILLPDSYRHYLNRSLKNPNTNDVSTRFARYRAKPATSGQLAGTYFYLGSEYPQHFGHVMTEQLSRLWAWPEVKRRYPDAKALVDLHPRYHELRSWEVDIFAAAGVDAEDLVAMAGPVAVETLIAATPMLVNTQYVHPRITDVWSRTAEALAARAPRRSYPDKVFISRKGSHTKRRCTNTEEVEAYFRGQGFTVLYPEDHGLPEQVMIFRQASVIAGFAGSALFTMLCCSGPASVIVLWPETYTSRNEYLICSAMGHRLAVFWCAPDRLHPTDGWTKKAYQSTYAFDFEADGARLDTLLAQS